MSESDRKKLVAALKKEFRGTVHSEKVGPKGRFRLQVISPKFKKMTQLQRQDAVWDIVNDALSREATLDVSLILTYAPAELADVR